ncbi:hypothetical protein ACKI1Q_35950 [Streptomyces galilaeus]|uniref:hypothetical protein n=1 Tax=Streptomyces galilaeus TaxID=33899 RepID=UPI0038F798B1
MDWMPLLSTLAGAAIGVAATLIAKGGGARKRDTLWKCGAPCIPSTPPPSKTRGKRYGLSPWVITCPSQLWLVGPPLVVAAGNEAFHSLRQIRDAYARGVTVGSAEDRAFIQHRRTAMAEMRRRMREDLGIGPLGIE